LFKIKRPGRLVFFKSRKNHDISYPVIISNLRLKLEISRNEPPVGRLGQFLARPGTVVWRRGWLSVSWEQILGGDFAKSYWATGGLAKHWRGWRGYGSFLADAGIRQIIGRLGGSGNFFGRLRGLGKFLGD
jgi:hypothetical protein